MNNFPLALGLATVMASVAVGCGGGVDAAPLDPLVGNSPASLAREYGRQPLYNASEGDDGTAHPAKAAPRGPREKHEKHVKGG